MLVACIQYKPEVLSFGRNTFSKSSSSSSSVTATNGRTNQTHEERSGVVTTAIEARQLWQLLVLVLQRLVNPKYLITVFLFLLFGLSMEFGWSGRNVLRREE